MKGSASSKLFTSWNNKFEDFDGGIEEFTNMVTHALGTVLSVVALVVMVWVAATKGSSLGIIGGVVFGSALILAYSASTLLHLPWIKQLKMRFLVLDQTMIFVLIAGTYTPVVLLAFPLVWAVSILTMIWGLAVAGIVLRLTYFSPDSLVLTGLYLALGWIGVIFGYWLVAAVGWTVIGLILTGGLTYSAGVIFYKWRSLFMNHAIWHLFVMTASAFHFAAVMALIMR